MELECLDNTEEKEGHESGVAITATIIRSQTLVSIAVRGRWYSCHDIASAAVTVRNATAPMLCTVLAITWVCIIITLLTTVEPRATGIDNVDAVFSKQLPREIRLLGWLTIVLSVAPMIRLV